MKVFLPLLSLLFFALDGISQPLPCTDPPTMTSTCAEACIICDIDGFKGRHQATIVGEAPPGFAGECTFTAHNMQWIAFIAGSVDLEVKLSVSNCSDGRGLEFGLYRGIDCQNYKRISNCFGGAAGIIRPGASGTIKNTEPLVIGQYYYIVMDGGLGDNCDWTFDVVAGDTRVAPLETSGPIDGYFSTCPDVENTYTVSPPIGATAFEWTLNNTVLDTDNDTIQITFEADAAYQLCVTASNACDEAPPSCRVIIVESIPTTFLAEKVCADEAYEVAGLTLDSTGIYEFPLLTEKGCDSLVILDLEVVPVPILDLDLNICEGDSLYIGDTPYLATGAHQERLLTDLGCDSIINLDLLVVICQIKASQVIEPVVCHGESSGRISFQVDRGTPPFSYNWAKIDDPSLTGTGAINSLGVPELIPDVPQGTYLINIFDNFGNTTILISDVPEPTPLAATFDAVDRNGFNVSCFDSADGQLTVLPSGGISPYQFLWEDGSQANQLQNLAANTYSVNITDNVGCISVFEYTLRAPADITFEILANDPDCEGIDTGSILFENVNGGAPDYNYQITGFPTNTAPLFDQLLPGEYEAVVTDENGCTKSESLSLVAAAIPSIDPIGDIRLNLGDSLLLQVLTNNVGLSNIQWDTLVGLSCEDCLTPVVNPLNTTDYTLSITSTDGCTTTASFTVQVLKNRRFYAPNIFSPNLDGQNDFFNVLGGGEVSKVLKLSVFDRWGGLVYENTELDHRAISSGWDGMYKGKIVENGVYVWVADIQFIDGYQEVFAGDVMVVK